MTRVGLRSLPGGLCLVVKLARLLPLEPVVLLLRLSEDQIGEDEGGNHREERIPHSPEDVGQTLRDCSSEGLLLHGREMVLGGTSDGHTEASEPKMVSDQGSPHDSFLAFISCRSESS